MNELPLNKIIHGDCLEVLKTLPENSVDSICCDPPYELGFMGKSWDNTGIANNKEMWAECLRVLKPGGHLLAFSGTRTYHRMAVAIEDAGFEVRDMIEWVYGCLSEDTEILTESGYKPLHKLTQYDRIGVYDITNNIYKWERPQRWSVYKVNQDTAYRIKSDYTDQIVSRNHRCLVEREGKLVFIQADELNEVEYMPTLSDDFYTLQEGHRKLLLKELLWKGKGLAQKLFCKWTGKEMPSERIEVRKEPSLERWSNLLEETRKLQADKICEVSKGVFTDGEKRWICNGTSFDNGSILGDMFRENPSSASYQSRPTGQPTGKPDVISIKQGTQITRRARVTKIEYSGIIFCPTVSTGAFIARRNGQVFITGNSGFPKSLNIGKAVDKLQGNERYNLGAGNTSCEYLMRGEKCIGHGSAGKSQSGDTIHTDLTKGTSEWEGWGTALKPAHEPICMARKPLAEKTVAENCLKYGTGGINIDESRVESNEVIETGRAGRSGASNFNASIGEEQPSHSKRFPANLLHDNSEEVRECFPETKSGGGDRNSKGKTELFTGFGDTGIERPFEASSGNASRFFKSILYVPKASKSERNKGCEGLENIIDRPFEERLLAQCKVCGNKGLKVGAGKQFTCGHTEIEYVKTEYKPSPNNHPTVKPIALMEYLIKMVTPKFVFVCERCYNGKYEKQKTNSETSPMQKLRGEIQTEGQLSQGGILHQEMCVPGGKNRQGEELPILQKDIHSKKDGQESTEILQPILCSTGYGNEKEGENSKNTERLFGDIQAREQNGEQTGNGNATQNCNGGENGEGFTTNRGGASYKSQKRRQQGRELNDNDSTGTQQNTEVKKESSVSSLSENRRCPNCGESMVKRAGVVLDPFAGSGSTLVAAKQNGYQYIGIELTYEYIPIIEARLDSLDRQPDLFDK